MMGSWDKSWGKIYQTQAYGARYPNEDLVRFMAGLYKSLPPEERKKVRVLEVGCGRGANIWYLAREGFSAWGIDGSETAIQMCRQRLEAEGLKAEVSVGDIIELPYPEGFFDVVVDIAAIQHNTPENITRIFSEIHRVLRKNGHLFSLVRSAKDYQFGRGREVAENTFTDIPEGDAKGVGTIHFFTVPEIEGFLKGKFGELKLEYSERTIEGMSRIIAHYIIVATKQVKHEVV
jgi:SAM-dependent methyltransferase